MASFVIGRGTVIEIAPLEVGDEVEPTPATLTSQALLTAKDIVPPAVLTLAAAIGAGIFIPKFTYLGFAAPNSKEVLVQLSDGAVTGELALDVFAIPAAIAASSIAKYPLRLSNRTEANLERSGNVTTLTTFDDDAWARGKTTGLSAKLSLPGAWSQLDPAYNTLEYQWTNGLDVYVWLKMLKPSADYAAGTIFKGVANIENLPVGVKADGIITGDISLSFNGRLTKVDPAPTP